MHKNKKHFYEIECTDSEYIEIEYVFKWYWKQWEKVKLFFRAFISRNELYSSKGNGGKDWEELSDEEKEEYRRVHEMKQSIRNQKHFKAIESGK